MRFANLGAREMSPDEGASWGAASASTIAEVISRQAIFNPGKLPIHDVMLHGWIALFGGSLVSMRAMSALLGTISILLVYMVAIEVERLPANPAHERTDRARRVAAIAALIYAVEIVTVKYSREARMYAVVLATMMAQIWIFLRVARRGGLIFTSVLAVLTAAGVGANFSAMLIPIIEGAWLGYVAFRSRMSSANLRARSVWMAATALAIGGAVLIPRLISDFGATTANRAGGIIRWIEPPAWYAPFALFNKATGSLAFPVLAALAIYGAYAAWRRGERESVSFALLWMWAPPMLMLIASFALTPLFVERYAIASFAAFFILAAIGIDSLSVAAAERGIRESIAMGALSAMVVVLALAHARTYDRKPHDAEYREAIAAALVSAGPSGKLTIVPAYAIEMAKFYLGPQADSRVVRYDSGRSQAAAIVVGEQSLSPRLLVEIEKEFPNPVASFRGASVRSRASGSIVK
jgi:4-amino-4-deoxy-L-arabinose transferase-like glycosyltransferase